MSLNNYADWVPQPPPVTTGTTTQSWVGPDLEVWVAKNGVNGGAWRRATDVLHSRVSRTSAYTYVAGTPTVMQYNNTMFDAYGLYVTASSWFLAPVTGLYRIHVMPCVTFTAAGQWIGINIGFSRTNYTAPAAGNMYCHLEDTINMTAGSTVAPGLYTNVALAAIVGNADNICVFDYLGTG